MKITFTPGPGVRVVGHSENVIIKEREEEELLVEAGAAGEAKEVEEVLAELDREEQAQAQILRAMLGTVKQYFGGFKSLLGGVYDPRNQKMGASHIGDKLLEG